MTAIYLTYIQQPSKWHQFVWQQVYCLQSAWCKAVTFTVPSRSFRSFHNRLWPFHSMNDLNIILIKLSTQRLARLCKSGQKLKYTKRPRNLKCIKLIENVKLTPSSFNNSITRSVLENDTSLSLSMKVYKPDKGRRVQKNRESVARYIQCRKNRHSLLQCHVTTTRDMRTGFRVKKRASGNELCYRAHRVKWSLSDLFVTASVICAKETVD